MRPLIQIPRSCLKRTSFEGAQLIKRIVQGRLGAFRFDGLFLRPGTLIPEAELWPDPEWPRVPHLIEIFPSTESRGGHGGSKIDIVLWRYISSQWREVCRMNGYASSEWMSELEPIISRSLEESRVHVEAPDMSAIAEELVQPIVERMSQLETREQREALATELHTKLMMMACGEQDQSIPSGLTADLLPLAAL